ncbi:MAG: exodeoxyribonuclease VII large subunit [Treponema sp.]|jgi:exodeoxyribonuclease VII large subunit|nr:exodeoxyribonuclease VII large subunit [Treponema sp.]
MDLSRKLTVSELTDSIKRNLEGAFPSLVVEGELSNCRPSSTGHLYFTLKDAGAAISGVMFKSRFRGLRFEPRDGMLLRVRGNLEVYAQRGAYQIICEEMEEAGAGDILALLEQRKRQLAAEGLFDEGRKKPIPRFPGTVGVITSTTGAAIQDVLNILRRRAAGIRVIILPTPVQGGDAAPVMVRRIEQANRWNLADVLILGRGGGSLEDLLPFSEEAVVRAVAASAIPVISAVGHEIDWVLSDFAADLRAPTPSAAAELVSASRGEMLETVRRNAAVLGQHIRSKIDRARLLVKPFSLEDLEYRIRNILQPRLVRFDDAKEGLLLAMGGRLKELRRRAELARNSLEAASPQAALDRGFSVVISRTTGRVVRRFSDVRAGEGLVIRPLEGLITAKTEAVYESPELPEEA